MTNLYAILLLWTGFLFAGPLAAGESGSDLLTPAERAWLAEHPDIVLGVGEEWAPAVVKDANGRFAGFAFDHVELLNAKLGTHFRLQAGPWHTLVEAAETRRIAGLTLTMPLEARKAHFLFTQPFHAVQYFIYLRTGQPLPNNGISGFRGQRVGYLKGILYLHNLLAAHPGIEATPLDSNEALAYALLRGEVDAVIDSYALEYWRASNGVLGFSPLQMVPGTQSNLVISVRKDWPELVTILNKGLAAITAAEQAELYRRSFGQDYLSRTALVRTTLTAEQQAWLAEHPVVRVGIDAHWAPVEFVDETGQPQGISVAYLQRLEKLLGLRIEFAQGLTWAEAKQRLADGSIDVLPTIAMTPDRQHSLHFTEPYLSFPVAIFSAADVAYLGDLRALEGKTVAIVQGEALQDWLHQDWPQLTLLPVANTREALRKVAEGAAFAFVGNLVTTSYYIGQSGLMQIRVVGETPYVYPLSMGVRQDLPMLAGILQKGLDAIPRSEQDAIYHDWISIRYQHGIDYGLLWRIMGLAALILLIIGYWNRRLAYEVQQRTADLYQANNRLRQLAMEISLIEERERQRLAGELHDSPMQKLALAQFQIVAGVRHRDAEAAEHLDTGLELLREALQELRTLQFELSPPLLYQEGLSAALDWLATNATRRFGVALTFAGPDVLPALERNLAIVLFQCVRELVYNVAKHAGATAGRIELTQHGQAVRVTVQDNGQGFPAAGMASSSVGGYGLFSIRERLALLGGELTIALDTGGSHVSIQAPLAPVGQHPQG